MAVTELGRTDYRTCWDLQKRLWECRHYGLIGDLLLLTEHDHVYTIGKGGDENHVLASNQELAELGAEVVRIDRGGDVTYHGPGQIVGYPILDLTAYGSDIHRYLRALEEVIILTLEDFDIEASREEGMTGVWVNGEKIGAIGVKVSRWVTMHGFALNVSTDLSRFDRIIPCGIFHKGVTSMERLLGRPVAAADVTRRLSEIMCAVFGATPVHIAPETINARIAHLDPGSLQTSAA
ncbi:MAG: lipoyl(octanoyl) transferase [Ignavibacteria bacterium RIFCSPLOWO2_02_FULL_55_14]|nr:MAG: lipoyl(octanoyl) transferase [Ignavibacteria bacterium RIFCSPLOWO2_12_FULL_56_21]OGU72810.1 MAG: lipoyl(octanoyl) transferase [Ignavibacteria bacterium RIFCSPLOWO2_02_FULL_55_14]